MSKKQKTQLDQLLEETGTQTNEQHIDFLQLFRDAPDQSPRFLLPTTGPVADAIAEVLAYNAAHKKECGILISKNGKKIERVFGDDHQVHFEPEQVKEFRGGTLVHNHPGPQPLSDQDSIMATGNNMKIWAVSDDGGYSSSEGFNLESLLLPIPQFAVHLSMNAGQMAGGFFHAFQEKEFISESQFQALLSQYSNLLLSESGNLKNYRYRVGSVLKEAIEAVKNHAKDCWEATDTAGALKKVGA